MNDSEILKSHEAKVSPTEESPFTPSTLTPNEVEEIYNYRQRCLQQIRPVISLKFYQNISAKLEREKKLFEQLLNWEDNKQEVLSHYSFVLSPYFFEQKFLN